MSPDWIFIIVVIIFSAIIHEVMHGVAADRLGDPTARYAGRLTLNPVPHIDLYGSIIVPVALVFLSSPIFFAWAKPVPYNPYNLRAGRFSEAIVAFAGPLSNAVIALITTLLIRLEVFGAGMNTALFMVVVVNVMLFIFNLIPIPPLDGSKVLEAFLPRSMQYPYGRWRNMLETQPFIGLALVIAFVLFLGSAFSSFIYTVARLLVGA